MTTIDRLWERGLLAPAPRGQALTRLEGLLPGLQPETIDALNQTMRAYTVPRGTVLMTEGERTNSLYVIESGHVAVYREAEDGSGERHLDDLSTGLTLGEMALLDERPRSASARAETECRLVELRPDDILALPNGRQVLADLRGSLAVTVTGRMRSQNDKYVAAMEREMAAIKERQHFGQFFLYTMAVMAIGMLVNDVVAHHLVDVNIYTQAFAWQYLLIIFVPTSLLIWRMNIPLRDLGVTTIGMRKSFVEGGVLSVLALVLTFAVAWGFSVAGVRMGTPVPAEWGATTSYFFHSLFQEFVARGLLQSSFQRFLDDQRGIRSIVLASLLFGVFHIHFGMMAVLLTILSGFVFGALYLRHRNLAGVTLLHFFVGGAAFWSGLL